MHMALKVGQSFWIEVESLLVDSWTVKVLESAVFQLDVRCSAFL